jgi:carboxyl-terminal processing protease
VVLSVVPGGSAAALEAAAPPAEAPTAAAPTGATPAGTAAPQGAEETAGSADLASPPTTIRPGDRILAAGDRPLAGLAVREALEALTGPDPALPAELVLQRADGQPFGVSVPHRPVEVPELAVDRPRPGVVMLRPGRLDARSLAALDAALGETAAEGPGSMVLDLRDNPGGDLETVRAFAGRFFDGQAWTELDRDGQPTARAAERSGAPRVAAPERLVVLVNGGTAGGAEMLAAALHEQAGARLIGEPTFGKAAIQSVATLADGSQLRLTVGSWQSPGGVTVADGGLEPDETVAGSAAQLDAALAALSGAKAAGG